MLSGVYSSIILFEHSILHSGLIRTYKVCFYPISHIILDSVINYRPLFIKSGRSMMIITGLTISFVMWVWGIICRIVICKIISRLCILPIHSFWDLWTFWNKIYIHVMRRTGIRIILIISNCSPISWSCFMSLIIIIIPISILIICRNFKFLVRITRININSIYSFYCPAVCDSVSNTLEFEYLCWHYTISFISFRKTKGYINSTRTLNRTYTWRGCIGVPNFKIPTNSTRITVWKIIPIRTTRTTHLHVIAIMCCANSIIIWVWCVA